jgi:hypothetical protein
MASDVIFIPVSDWLLILLIRALSSQPLGGGHYYRTQKVAALIPHVIFN